MAWETLKKHFVLMWSCLACCFGVFLVLNDQIKRESSGTFIQMQISKSALLRPAFQCRPCEANLFLPPERQWVSTSISVGLALCPILRHQMENPNLGARCRHFRSECNPPIFHGQLTTEKGGAPPEYSDEISVVALIFVHLKPTWAKKQTDLFAGGFKKI